MPWILTAPNRHGRPLYVRTRPCGRGRRMAGWTPFNWRADAFETEAEAGALTRQLNSLFHTHLKAILVDLDKDPSYRLPGDPSEAPETFNGPRPGDQN